MMTKFFPHGTGGGAGPVNYVMGAVEQGKGQVMAGDPTLTRQLIDTAPGRHRYTSGVISFSKDEKPTDEQLRQVIEDYNRFFSADDAVAINVLWVKHEDKGRTELHFVIPNVDLNTGRVYHPYLDRFDRKTVDTLQTALIAENGFADPKDPARKQWLSNPNDYLKTTKDRKELLELVNSYMSELMATKLAMGDAWTHSDTLGAIRDLGLEITRHGKNYITVQNESGVRAKLKGGIYERDCVIDGASPEATARASEQHREQLRERATDLRADYEKRLSKRAERIAKRYSNSRDISQDIEKQAAERARESRQRHENDYELSDEAGRRVGQHRAHDAPAYGKDGNHFYRCDRADTGVGCGRSDGVDHLLHQTGNSIQPAAAKTGTGAQRSADKTERQNIHSDAENRKMLDRWQKESVPAFRVIEIEFRGRKLGEIVDYGNSLVAHGMSSKAAAYNIIKEAQHKGWKRIELDGDSEFLENAMAMALKRGIEVVPKSKSQELMLERIKREIEYDRVREVANRAIETAKRASRNIERASQRLGRTGAELERKGGAFDQRIGRTDELKGGLKMAYDTELERFKTDIPIQQYLQDQGWVLDKKKSSKKHAVLTDGRSKVVVSRAENGHYIYFDVGTGKGGSIIDLVQDLTHKNLGQVRKELRRYVGGEIERHSSSLSPIQHLEKSSRDEQEVARLAERWSTLKTLDQRYINSRGISQVDDRFSNIRTDERGNTCFPHYAPSKRIVGWEKKNYQFTGFEKGSLRSESIYATTNLKNASQVVIVESGIDALSHAQLFNTDDSVAYISIGGQLTDKQVELIKRVTHGKHVIVATDNDEAGFKYADKLKQELGQVSWQIPEQKDWNDDLKVEQERAATRSRSSRSLGM